jgi:hypothetical protein
MPFIGGFVSYRAESKAPVNSGRNPFGHFVFLLYLASLKFVPVNLAELKSVPRKSAKCKFALLKFVPSKFAPLRSALPM